MFGWEQKYLRELQGNRIKAVLCAFFQVWVDSDGKVANNAGRMAGLSDPRGNAEEGPTSVGALIDHQWHMLTVSTQPDHTKGFR